MKQQTVKELETEGVLFGLCLSDFALWAMYTVGLIILPFVTGILQIELGFWYYVFVLVTSIVFFRVLKYFSKKKYPKYILSWLGYQVQPKHIDIRYRSKELDKETNKEK